MALSHQQQEALAFITHFTGFLSLVGSSWIMYEIFKDKTKWDKTYHRLLFVMSFFDFLTSIAMGLSSIPIPRGTENVYYGFGNTTTCSAQGFFIHLSIIGPFYNACLSIYYVLKVRTGMQEKDILKYVEPFMHLICNVAAWTIAFVALFLGMYNNSTLWCSINDFPGNCQGGTGEPGPVPCERGYNAWVYRWAFYYGPLWLTLIIVPAMMFLLYAAVRQQEKICERYDMEAKCKKFSTRTLVEAVTSKRKVQWSKKVASQSLFYTISFYMTFIFATMNRLTQLIANKDYFALLLLHILFAPLQGFFNFLVYMRPRYLRWHAKKFGTKKQKKMPERMMNIISASTTGSNPAQHPNTLAHESRLSVLNSKYFRKPESSGFSDYEGESFQIPSFRSTQTGSEMFAPSSLGGHSRHSSAGSAADLPNVKWWDKFKDEQNDNNGDKDNDSDHDSDNDLGIDSGIDMKEQSAQPTNAMENHFSVDNYGSENDSKHDNCNENESGVELMEERKAKSKSMGNFFSKSYKNGKSAIHNDEENDDDIHIKAETIGAGHFPSDSELSSGELYIDE